MKKTLLTALCIVATAATLCMGAVAGGMSPVGGIAVATGSDPADGMAAAMKGEMAAADSGTADIMPPTDGMAATGLADSSFTVTAHRVGWDEVPPQACRDGYYVQLTQDAQMDGDPETETVIAFGRDKGHYPEFDLFQTYWAIIGSSSKTVKYMSGEFVTDKYGMLLEDRNGDGRSELYVSYLLDGSFSVDERGYNMTATRCHDRIEFAGDAFQAGVTALPQTEVTGGGPALAEAARGAKGYDEEVAIGAVAAASKDGDPDLAEATGDANGYGEEAGMTAGRQAAITDRSEGRSGQAETRSRAGREQPYRSEESSERLGGRAKAKKTEADKIRTLIIAGQDGSHWWRGAGEAIRQILENSGLFQADLLFTPDFGEDMSGFHPAFSDYDLVVLDYGGEEWADEVKADFESYVRGGGGVTVMHSAIIPMENWAEYNLMTGLGAWNGRDERWGPYLYMDGGKYVYDYSPGYAGHHGLQHRAVIEHQAQDHPIVKGLPRRWLHYKDEIYTNLRGPAKGIEIIATTHDDGKDQPLLWTVGYGEGRVFVDVLGHCGNDPELNYSLTCAGFQVTFLRGCEWAATGKVSQAVPKDFPLEGRCTLRPDFKAPSNAF